jgi:hypothetical protein
MKDIKPVYIPEKTRKEMAEFFAKTSVPRILAERNKKEKENEHNNKD